jgi:hypothetical protein
MAFYFTPTVQYEIVTKLTFLLAISRLDGFLFHTNRTI